MAALANVEQVPMALKTDAPHDIQYRNQPLGRMQYAIAGDYLAVRMQVLDARITPTLKAWPDTAVDILASVPGTDTVRQVVFLPKGPGGGPVNLNENGHALPAPQVAWQVTPLPDHGYTLTALIPLTLFQLDAAVHEFLFDCAVCAAPAPDAPVQYQTLFRSYAAFHNNSRFGRLIVE
jgi:hypothetical protein